MFAVSRTFNTESYAELLETRQSHKRRRGLEDAGPSADNQDVPARDPTVEDGNVAIHDEHTSNNEPGLTPRNSGSSTSRASLSGQPATPIRPQDNPSPRRPRQRRPRNTESSRSVRAGRTSAGGRVLEEPAPEPQTHNTQATTPRPNTGLRRTERNSAAHRRGSRTPASEQRSSAAEAHGDKTLCDFCDKDLRGRQQHRCQDCHVLLCSNCMVNLAILHPGHTVEPPIARPRVRPRGQVPHAPSPPRSQSDRMPFNAPIVATRHDQACHLCQQRLLGMLWECQDCPEKATFCADCRAMHPDEHSLLAVACPAIPDIDGDSGLGLDGDSDIDSDDGNDLAGDNENRQDGYDDGDTHGHQRDEDANINSPRNDEPHDDELHDNNIHDDEQPLDDLHERDADSPALGSRHTSRQPTQSPLNDRAFSLPPPSPAPGPAHSPPPPQRERASMSPEITVTFSREKFKQFNALIQAMAGTSASILRSEGRVVSAHYGDGRDDRAFEPVDVLDFDLNDHKRPRQQANQPTNRRWLDTERRRLRRMKRNNSTIGEIALALNRSESAVIQQWRKMNL